MQPRPTTNGKRLPPNLAPIGVNREEAAIYIGVSTSLFDTLVETGVMPQPRKVGNRRKVWAVTELEAAFFELPHNVTEDDESDGAENIWDDE